MGCLSILRRPLAVFDDEGAFFALANLEADLLRLAVGGPDLVFEAFVMGVDPEA